MAFNSRHPFGATPYHPEELQRRRDDWYATVRRRTEDLATRLHHNSTNYPHSKPLRGSVQFDYSHHDGYYRLGEGNCEFLTHWSKASDTSIYCYRDGTNVSLALPPKNIRLQEITEASLLNFSSRVRTPQIGQFVVLENHCGRYAALKLLKIQDDTRGHLEDLLAFDYWILEDGTDSFADLD